MTSPFPVVTVAGTTFEFFPGHMPDECAYSLVVPWHEGTVVLTHIYDRGWCIPSGRLEPGESPDETARREAFEEASIALGEIVFLGSYRLTASDQSESWACLYTGQVVALDPFDANEESAGRRLVPYEDLPGVYYQWDELMESVFAFARRAADQYLG